MIRTTHAELAMLRRGATRVLPVPPRRPAPGARRGKPPAVEGRVYRVFAPALWKPGPPRELDRARAEMRVLVLGLVEEPSRWMVTVRGGYGAEEPVFLAASPGTQRADYVPTPGRALHDEGEVLGESPERLLARMKVISDDLPRRVSREKAMENLRLSIEALEAVSTVSERGQIQRLRAQLHRMESREHRAGLG